MVSYVVSDSGGSIKVAGIGTYVSATDDITRNDTWNFSGGVVDKNPAANITLSAGTHTVSCDVVGNTIDVLTPMNVSGLSGNYVDPFNDKSGGSKAMSADVVHIVPMILQGKTSISALGAFQVSVVGGTKLRTGLYQKQIGRLLPGKLICETLDVDTSVTGYNRVASLIGGNKDVPAGLYYIGILSDGTPTLPANNINNGPQPFIESVTGTQRGVGYSYAVTAGWSSMPADLSLIGFTNESYNTVKAMVVIA